METEQTRSGGPWTSHGHGIPGITVMGNGPRPPAARCGGVRLCNRCREDAAQFSQRIFDAIETPDVEVTVTMRVPMSESTYRKLKAAASLRGVGQGQLAAQIIEESLPQFMNFGPSGESFPFERNQMPGSGV